MLKRPLLILGVLVVVLACPLSASAATIPGQYIVVLKDGANAGAAVKKARSLGGAVTQEYRHALKGYAAQLTSAQLATVKADRSVRIVVPDTEINAAVKPGPPPPQPAQQIGNGVKRIGGDQSSTVSGDGTGSVPINVAVLDGGIQPDHPDLNVVGGINCAGGSPTDWSDRNGHGTMVGGFIGALDNAIGRVGVAPGARLWSARVLSKSGQGSLSKVVCGLDWATGTQVDADPDNDIAIANLSLGGDGPADDGNCGRDSGDALHVAVCAAVAEGIVVVASAGNSSEDIAFTGRKTLPVDVPSSYNEVLTATAMGDRDGVPGGLGGQFVCPDGNDQFDDFAATFSNFASLAEDQAHTIAAPGVCINSTYFDSVYATLSGTSFSAPLAAGTVALCLASGSQPCAGLTPAQIIQKIVADATAYNTANPSYGFTGDPLHSPDPNRYYGFLIRAGLY